MSVGPPHGILSVTMECHWWLGMVVEIVGWKQSYSGHTVRGDCGCMEGEDKSISVTEAC